MVLYTNLVVYFPVWYMDTFDIPRMRTRMGDCALLVAGPRAWMHFRQTFVVHSAWTLLRSVSNHICFLLLMIYNNFFLP